MDELGSSPKQSPATDPLTEPVGVPSGRIARVAVGTAGSARRMLTSVIRPDRLLLAFKAALGATVAWLLGNQLPGALADYAFYAPFGAILALTPTVMDSVRSSLHTLLGLALGIGLAWIVIRTGAPGVVAVAVAAGVGTWVAGALRPGPGRDYVPVAALFVLILGGADTVDYTWGYLIQVALGLAIGALVTILISPPLLTRDASAAIGETRRASATLARRLARLARDPEMDETRIQTRTDAYRRLLEETDAAIELARRSRRANPRRRWKQTDLSADEADLDALRRLGRHLGDVGELMGVGGRMPDVLAEAPAGVRASLASSLDGLSQLIGAWEDGTEPDEDEVRRRIQLLQADLAQWQPEDEWTRDALAAIVVAVRSARAAAVSRTG